MSSTWGKSGFGEPKPTKVCQPFILATLFQKLPSAGFGSVLTLGRTRVRLLEGFNEYDWIQDVHMTKWTDVQISHHGALGNAIVSVARLVLATVPCDVRCHSPRAADSKQGIQKSQKQQRSKNENSFAPSPRSCSTSIYWGFQLAAASHYREVQCAASSCEAGQLKTAVAFTGFCVVSSQWGTAIINVFCSWLMYLFISFFRSSFLSFCTSLRRSLFLCISVAVSGSSFFLSFVLSFCLNLSVAVRDLTVTRIFILPDNCALLALRL